MASNGIFLMKQLVTKKAPSFPVTESECTLKDLHVYSSSIVLLLITVYICIVQNCIQLQ